MAGYCRGPNPIVGREEFALTYLRAVQARQHPAVAVKTQFGMTQKKYERARALLSKHGWLPYGRLSSADVPRAMEMFKAKLAEVQRGELAREDARAARERRAELRQLRARAAAQKPQQVPRGVILDRFGL